MRFTNKVSAVAHGAVRVLVEGALRKKVGQRCVGQCRYSCRLARRLESRQAKTTEEGTQHELLEHRTQIAGGRLQLNRADFET